MKDAKGHGSNPHGVHARGISALGTLYHVTPTANLPAIMKSGLRPQIGDRATAYGEKVPGVYTFNSRGDAEDAVANWLGEQFDDDTDLALLSISPNNGATVPGAGFEKILTEPVHPSRIKIVKRSL